MDLPRLILAEERRPGKVPSGVLLAAALKQRGYRLRLFVAGGDEGTLRLAECLCGQRCSYLDPVLCGSGGALRSLFQAGADPEALNLVLAPLGSRSGDDAPFLVHPETRELASLLGGGLVPIFCADTSAMVAARTVEEVARQLESVPEVSILGTLFLSVPFPREYQLLDRDLGRRLPWMGLGYVPRELERPEPPLGDLCNPEVLHRTLIPLRTAAAHLQSLEDQIQWPLFGALARVGCAWEPEPPLEPLFSRPRVAVLRHPGLSLSGEGPELLLQALGCSLLDIPLAGGAIPRECDAAYLPHGLGFLALVQFLENRELVQSLGQILLSGRGLLAEGGAAPLLGEQILLPSGKGARGASLFSLKGIYREPRPGSQTRLFVRARAQGPLLGEGESLRGVASRGVFLSGADPQDGDWEVREDPAGAPTGMEGWSLNRAVVTRLRLELWSCPLPVRRWLLGRGNA